MAGILARTCPRAPGPQGPAAAGTVWIIGEAQALAPEMDSFAFCDGKTASAD
jgi:hypothetical protein